MACAGVHERPLASVGTHTKAQMAIETRIHTQRQLHRTVQVDNGELGSERRGDCARCTDRKREVGKM